MKFYVLEFMRYVVELYIVGGEYLAFLGISYVLGSIVALSFGVVLTRGYFL